MTEGGDLVPVPVTEGGDDPMIGAIGDAPVPGHMKGEGPVHDLATGHVIDVGKSLELVQPGLMTDHVMGHHCYRSRSMSGDRKRSRSPYRYRDDRKRSRSRSRDLERDQRSRSGSIGRRSRSRSADQEVKASRSRSPDKDYQEQSHLATPDAKVGSSSSVHEEENGMDRSHSRSPPSRSSEPPCETED